MAITFRIFRVKKIISFLVIFIFVIMGLLSVINLPLSLIYSYLTTSQIDPATAIIFILLILLNLIIFKLVKLLLSRDFNFQDGKQRFRIWGLKWITTVQFEIVSLQYKFSLNIKTFLENNPQITWGYFIVLSNKGNKLIIRISAKKKLIPYKYDKLVKIARESLLFELDCSIITLDAIPNEYLFYSLKFHKNLTSIKQILSAIDQLKIRDLIICAELSSYRLNSHSDLKKFVESNSIKNFISSNNSFSQTREKRYTKTARYFGKNLGNRINKSLQLLQYDESPSNSLYTFIIDSMISIEKIHKNNVIGKMENRLASILSKYPPDIPLFEAQLKIGIRHKDKNQIKGILTILSSIMTNISLKKDYRFYTYKNEIWKLIDIPNLYIQPNSLDKLIFDPNNKPDCIIGNFITNKNKNAPFGFSIQDFNEGGIITGAIGTGKTTLRLHIIKFMLLNNIQVIDFDLKGDAPRYEILGNKGIILIPGINFCINPFECPEEYSFKEYSDILIRTFFETLPGFELTSPQKHLFINATYQTVKESGNTRDFFSNILLLGNMEQKVVDNYQENTAHALIVRLNWMQNSLGEIFWYNSSTLSESDIKANSLFFDFSHISHIATHDQIRFLLDLITTKIMSSVKNSQVNIEGRPNTVIFLDESQFLMPRKLSGSHLSKIEETLSTLRYKGISVIATGISSSYMSKILLDTNFIAQFRSENQELLRGMGLFTKEEIQSVPMLEKFNCMIKSKGLSNKSYQIEIHKFNHIQDEGYIMRVNQQILTESNPLHPFVLNHQTIWYSRIHSIFSIQIGANIINNSVIIDEVLLFVEAELIPIINRKADRKAEFLSEQIYLLYIDLMRRKVLSQKVKEDPKQFLLRALFEFFIITANSLQNEGKLNSLEHILEKKISNTINYLIERIDHFVPLLDSPKISYYQLLINRIKSNRMTKIENYHELSILIRDRLMDKLRNLIFAVEIKDLNKFDLEFLIGIAYDLNLINQRQYAVFTSFHVKLIDKKLEYDLKGVNKLFLNVDKEIELIANTSIVCD